MVSLYFIHSQLLIENWESVNILRTLVSLNTTLAVPEPSSSYILKAHLSFSSTEPEVVMSVAIMNSCAGLSLLLYSLLLVKDMMYYIYDI